MNALDRLPTENDKQYQGFLDYCYLGVGRSLARLLERYLHQARTQNSPPPPTRNLRTLKSWSVNNNWQERVRAFDATALETEKELREQQRERLIANELQDYESQLVKWRDVLDRTKLHQAKSEQTLEDGTQVKFLELNIADWHQLARWRIDISKQGRLALNLPDKVTENKIGGDVGMTIKVVYEDAITDNEPTDD